MLRRDLVVGTLLVAAAATLLGVNGTVSRIVIDAGVDPLRITQARLAGSALILLIWLAIRDPGFIRMPRRDMVELALYGVFGILAMLWLYLEAIARIPISVALVIEHLAPLFVAIWVRLVLGRRLPLVAWIMIPVALIGLSFVLGVGSNDVTTLAPLGVFAALLLACAYAYYNLHGERVIRGRSAAAATAVAMFWATVVLAVAQPWWTFPFDLLTPAPSDAPLHVPTGVYLFFVVFFGTLLPFVLMVAGVRRIGAEGVSVTTMLEPLVAGLVAWVVLDQVLTVLQVLGALTVIAAVTLIQVSRARAAARAAGTGVAAEREVGVGP